jgi:hypothetical protein
MSVGAWPKQSIQSVTMAWSVVFAVLGSSIWTQ